MSKKARIAAVLSAPVIGALSFLGLGLASATPAGAAAPISVIQGSNGAGILIDIPGVYLVIYV